MRRRVVPSAGAHKCTERPALSQGVILVLGLAVLLNYVDRANLAIAAPLLQDELSLSAAQIGVLLSSFFWVYAPAQLLAGWLVHRFDIRVVLAAGIASLGPGDRHHRVSHRVRVDPSSAPGARSRRERHVSELAVDPRAPHGRTRARAGERDHRRRAGCRADAGHALRRPGDGPVRLARDVHWPRGHHACLALAVVRRDARPKLRCTGRARLCRRSPIPPSSRRREFWGAALGHFSINYGFYFVMTWLPTFLVKAGGFTVPQMAGIGFAIYGIYAVATALAGALSDRWIRHGGSATLRA